MKHIYIIGNSAAAISAVESIRLHDQESQITIISEEEYPAYGRCLISYLLAGDIPESKLNLRPADFYQQNKVDLLLGKKVVELSVKKRRVTLDDGEKKEFDVALIATGARPDMPEIKGIGKQGVSGFRTLNETKELISIATFAKAACVLGGGLIGLKAAYALKKRGLNVLVIVKSKHVLSQVLDDLGAKMVGRHLEAKGIEILIDQDVSEIIGNGQVRAIKLLSGKAIEASIVIVGKGVKPNIQFLKESGINTDFGILTNEYLETNVQGIFAAGDVCQSFDLVRGAAFINALWPNAVEQGRIAGLNIVGKNLKYIGSLSLNAVEFFGLPIVSMGLKKAEPGCETLEASNGKAQIYKKFILKDNHLKGFIGIGNIKNSGIFLRMIREGVDISSVKNDLLSDSFSYAKVMDLFGKDGLYSNYQEQK
jgi:NAD(P)H-nitrite reductase large subunit